MSSAIASLFGKFRLWAACAVLLCIGVMAHADAGRTMPMERDWRFLRADVVGAEMPDYDDAAWAQVALPHTWNAVDGETAGAYYRGPGWYRNSIDLPAYLDERRRWLEFDGAALAADVWVNGHHAGHHEGGFARFRFDVSGLLHPGHNSVAVRVDNAPNDGIAPLGGDFTVFGGLYRNVRLVEVSALHIDLQDQGGPGVQVSVETASSDAARLQVTTRLRNDHLQPEWLAMRQSLSDAQGHLVLRQQSRLQIAEHATLVQLTTLQLTRPHLWQGVRDPYLYNLKIELLQRGQVVDSVDLPLGVRTVAVDPQRGFLLNGQPYPLHGVNYFHPGRPGKGLAVSDAEIDEDFRILQELGLTGLRLVHFQHPQHVYELADRLGLVLWTEIPLNSAMDAGAPFRANITQQLLELQRQTGNHPSVAIWGLGNEVYRADAAARSLLAELHTLAKQQDPLRPSAYAHCCAADDDPLSMQTAVTGYNRYYGWYDGELPDIGPWADRVHALLPGRAIGLSEYGAGGSTQHQQDPPERPTPNGRWHPEQYQALFHEAYWHQIESRPWLWGSFVWVGFDLASAGRNEGDRPGFNDKGLVSYDRQVRKDAYYWYQSNWSQVPMASISSRRFTPRPAGTVAVKVYTNASRAMLKVDGVSKGSVSVAGHVALWPAVLLLPGRHHLSVSTDHGATDMIDWDCTP